MAAISANGGRELARFTKTSSGDFGSGVATSWKSHLVLTSDGRILHKLDKDGYTLAARVKDAGKRTAADLIAIARKYAANRGYAEANRP